MFETMLMMNEGSDKYQKGFFKLSTKEQLFYNLKKEQERTAEDIANEIIKKLRDKKN